MWGRIAARMLKRPGVALTIGVVVFGALSAAVVNYQSAGFGGTISAPAGTDSAAGTDLLNKYFPSTAANPTNLVYPLSVPAWQTPRRSQPRPRSCRRRGVFTGVTGPLNPVGGTGFTPAQYTQLHALLGSGTLPATRQPSPPRPPRPGSRPPVGGGIPAVPGDPQFVSADGKTIQFETSLTAGDPSTTAALNAVPAVRAGGLSVVPMLHATDSGVAGEAPAIYDINAISNSDLAHVIPIAIIVIGVLLALVMRSLIAPLYLIASVALSYFAALGLAVLVFIELGDSGGITFILPFLLFIFLLALGEDYNILVMTRIREEAHHLPLREAVRRAVGVTGTTVTSAGLVLAGTFAVFARRRRQRLRRRRRSATSASASRSASSWTRSWSAPCSCPARWCCSAGGTGGRPNCTWTRRRRDGRGGGERRRARAVRPGRRAGRAGRPVRREHRRQRVTQKILNVTSSSTPPAGPDMANATMFSGHAGRGAFLLAL